MKIFTQSHILLVCSLMALTISSCQITNEISSKQHKFNIESEYVVTDLHITELTSKDLDLKSELSNFNVKRESCLVRYTNELTAQAQNEYKDLIDKGDEIPSKFHYFVRDSIYALIPNELISIIQYESIATESENLQLKIKAYNYNLLTHKFLHKTDIFKDINRTSLNQLIFEIFNEQNIGNVALSKQPNVKLANAIAMTTNKLVLFYNPGTIADSSYGIIKITIPKSKLVGYLKFTLKEERNFLKRIF